MACLISINRCGKTLKAALAVFVFLLVSSPPQSMSAQKSAPTLVTEIRFREYTLITSEIIFLGDISEIKAPEFLKEEFEKIEMSRSPKPGSMKILEKNQIESVLRACKFLPENADILIPAKVYIKRDSQELTPEIVAERLTAYLEQSFHEKEFELEQFRIHGLEAYPAGDLEVVFVDSDLGSDGGKISLYADVLVDGKKQDRLMVSGWINVYELLVCSSKDIDKGQMIDETNSKILRVNVSKLKRGPFAASIEDIEGKILKVSLKEGECIRLDSLENKPVIQKGSQVQLIAQKENLFIVTSGISKEDGYMNQLIRVENISSGKLVRGLVKGKSKVQVLY